MRLTKLIFLGAMLAALVAPMTVHAAPSAVQKEMLASYEEARDKLLELAEATPQDKYSWRPGEGVRSQAEVFLHVAAANYGIPAFWGVKAPKGFAFQDYEQSMTDKADIETALKASFAHMTKAFMAMSPEQLSKEVELFGKKTTILGGYMILVGHVHEHLGQSIAYARTNGIVPPWTAREQAAAKEE